MDILDDMGVSKLSANFLKKKSELAYYFKTLEDRLQTKNT